MHLRFRGRASARPGLALIAGLLLTVTGPSAALAQSSAVAARPILDLGEALARASAADPAATGWDARLGAAQASVRQAGVKPNPSLGFELENFAGSGTYSVLDRTEATLSYQQTLERGGKREARIGLARAGAEVTRRRRDVRRLDLLRDVQVAYAEALAAEADLLIAEARLVAAQSAQTDVDRRVRAARDPLFAGSRAEAATAQAEIERDQARAAARNAREVVARYWGGAADFALNLETFFGAVPPSGDRAVAVADLALLEAEREVASSNVRLEQSRAVTDPTLRAGLRYFGDGNDVALVVGGTLPLRLHDNNKGAIDRAISERSAAEADITAERVLREREIARLMARMAASATESERLRAEVIPVAIRAVEQVRDGFNRGGFQYMNVADAERALADARARRVAVLRQFHLDQAALDRLTGRHAALASSNLNAERR
ncbi:MAG: TolC family protein [Phenylobacterium sp.]|uniref:TolC family protein n=1 Tax=Phenylobacterium sp. TaxID=1871053 RepID=UPI001A244C8E|nr:TolC family protein [Phenylobacterium sp.]MBJ7409036.1 TolC family protein [Phenylobacterium sp.]